MYGVTKVFFTFEVFNFSSTLLLSTAPSGTEGKIVIKNELFQTIFFSQRERPQISHPGWDEIDESLLLLLL